MSTRASPRLDGEKQSPRGPTSPTTQSPRTKEKEEAPSAIASAGDGVSPRNRISPRPLNAVAIGAANAGVQQQQEEEERDENSNSASFSPKALTTIDDKGDSTPPPQPSSSEPARGPPKPQVPIEVINALNPYYIYPNANPALTGRKHVETISVDALIADLAARQSSESVAASIRRTNDLERRRAVLSQALRTLQAREAAVESTEASSLKLLLFDERIQRKEKEVEQREIQIAAKDAENQKTERELRAREREQQQQYERRVEPLAAREFQIGRKEDDLRTIESALEARVNQHSSRINAEEDAMRARERTLRDNEVRLVEQLESSAKAQAEYQSLHQLWQRKHKQLLLDEEQLNAREKELAAREAQLFGGEKTLLAAKQKLSANESEFIVQKTELQAATAQLEAQRAALRQRELKHEAAVARLVDAQSELARNESGLERKANYSDKVTKDAAEAYKDAHLTLRGAEGDRAAAADLRARAEEKLKAAMARERGARRFQQGLEAQRAALEAANSDLASREARLEGEKREVEQLLAQLQQHSGLGSRSGTAAAFGGLGGGDFFNATLSGFSRLGTSAYGHRSASGSGPAPLAIPPYVHSSSPVNMQQKSLEVAQLYGKPQSRKLVKALAQRSTSNPQLSNGSKRQQMLQLPAVGGSGRSHSQQQQHQQKNDRFSSTAPIGGSAAIRGGDKSHQFSTSATVHSAWAAGGANSRSLLPPIASKGSSSTTTRKGIFAATPTASPRSSSGAAERDTVVGKEGPLGYDNPFAATNSAVRRASRPSSRATSPTADGRKGRSPTAEEEAALAAAAAKMAGEAFYENEKSKNARRIGSGQQQQQHGKGRKGRSPSPPSHRQSEQSAGSSRAPSSASSIRSTTSSHHRSRPSSSSASSPYASGSSRAHTPEKKKTRRAEDQRKARRGHTAGNNNGSDSEGAVNPPNPDGPFVEFLRNAAHFWALEKRCKSLDAELEAHLGAMKAGSVTPASASAPSGAADAVGGADPDDVSWTVEGGKSATNGGTTSKKKIAPRIDNGHKPKESGAGTGAAPPAPSAYRLVPADAIYECVYVKGAQKDAETECAFIFEDILLPAASSTAASGDAKGGGVTRGKGDGDDAALVYRLATALFNASQNAGRNEKAPLARIVATAHQRALRLMQQRAQWLEGALAKIEEGLREAEAEDAEGKEAEAAPNRAYAAKQQPRRQPSEEGSRGNAATREPSHFRHSSASSTTSSRSSASRRSDSGDRYTAPGSDSDASTSSSRRKGTSGGDESHGAYSSDAHSD